MFLPMPSYSREDRGATQARARSRRRGRFPPTKFLERRKAEVQLLRIHLPRTSVNMAKRKGRGTQPRPRSGGTSIRSGATSPRAQASRLARLAVVGCQAIARAALVPEDVGLVSEDRVADEGVVGGCRPSFEALAHDYPAGEGRGPGWNVADDVVPLNLH